MTADRELPRTFFRGVYLTSALALAALAALTGVAWGGRVAAGIALGGAISIAVLLSWQWLAGWVIVAPRSKLKRRLILAWPLKYAAIGAALWLVLRRDLVNVFALVAGLSVTQGVMFGRALLAARAQLRPSKDSD